MNETLTPPRPAAPDAATRSLTKADFENAIAGTSPLATVSRLPGVNFPL